MEPGCPRVGMEAAVTPSRGSLIGTRLVGYLLRQDCAVGLFVPVLHERWAGPVLVSAVVCSGPWPAVNAWI